MMRIFAVSLALLAVAPPCLARASDPAAANEIRIVGIIANSPLSPEEDAALSRTAVSNASATAHLLALYDHASEQARVAWRTATRRGVELASCDPTPNSLCTVEHRIIEAHDPVVLVDRPRKLVFTRASIIALVAGARMISGRLGIAPPGDAAAQQLAGELRRRDGQGQTEDFDAMEAAAGNDFNLPRWKQSARTASVSKIHDIIAAEPDETARVFSLAMEAALAGKVAGQAGSSGSGAAGGAMAGMMKGQAMQRMVRSMSPSCMGPGTGGNFGFCAGYQ